MSHSCRYLCRVFVKYPESNQQCSQKLLNASQNTLDLHKKQFDKNSSKILHSPMNRLKQTNGIIIRSPAETRQ